MSCQCLARFAYVPICALHPHRSRRLGNGGGACDAGAGDGFRAWSVGDGNENADSDRYLYPITLVNRDRVPG